MTKAWCIPWHKYTEFGSEFYKPLLDFFTHSLNSYKDEFDVLYMLDCHWGFTDEEKKALIDIKKDTVFLQAKSREHHWVGFKDAIPQIPEDAILFTDNDVVFYKSGIIDSWFKKIEEGYDFLGNFDGSGTNQTVMEKYPWMKEKGYNRMGSYYFILTKKLLETVGEYDFAPVDGFDSFGKFTLQMLETNPKIWEIPDDRSNVVNWNPLETELNTGFYHVRAGSRIPYLLASKHYGHSSDYWDAIYHQPHSEIKRQVEWYKYMGSNVDEIMEDLKHE